MVEFWRLSEEERARIGREVATLEDFNSVLFLSILFNRGPQEVSGIERRYEEPEVGVIDSTLSRLTDYGYAERCQQGYGITPEGIELLQSAGIIEQDERPNPIDAARTVLNLKRVEPYATAFTEVGQVLLDEGKLAGRVLRLQKYCCEGQVGLRQLRG